MTNQLLSKNTSLLAVESTRQRILLAADEEMYEHGFQGMRIESVLKKTQLAKGALYHYFPTKLALGYAVVDEVIIGYFQENWSHFVNQSQDPLQALKDFFAYHCAELQAGECLNGCPIGNLVQEMSTLDEGFHQRLQLLMTNIVTIVSTALHEGQVNGIVRKDVDPTKVAMFMFSSYQGIMGVSKCMKSLDLVIQLFDTLSEYVESLRAPT